MSTLVVESGLIAPAYSISVKPNGVTVGDVTDAACITVVLNDTREGDLPIPRFRQSFVKDDEQKLTPYLIGMPNFLKRCDTFIPPNGGIVTNLGKQMDIFYVSVDAEGGILFNARTRVVERLDELIGLMDVAYKRDPYQMFVLAKR